MKLLLLNGVYGADEHFAALRSALAPGIETGVFAFRREGLPDPSHHDAFAPMIARLDRALDAFAPAGDDEAPALLGFSLGAALALEYVCARPERVRALVLVNGFLRYRQGALQ